MNLSHFLLGHRWSAWERIKGDHRLLSEQRVCRVCGNIEYRTRPDPVWHKAMQDIFGHNENPESIPIEEWVNLGGG